MSPNVKTAVKTLLRSALDYRYHYLHVKQANALRRGIEAARGKTPARDIKLCKEYAVEVLGHKHFAPWLYVYCSIAGGFREGWIPDNFYGAIVVPTFKGLYGKVSSLKPLNTAIFGSEAFPDLASYINGIFVTRNYNYVSPNIVKELLFGDQDRVVFKLGNSAQGKAIYLFDKETFDVDKIKGLGNGLFQSYIRQHSLFDTFAANSVATLRLTTILNDDGSVSVRACYLRLGSGSDTHVQSQNRR